MGEVYRAHDSKLGRDVAIKVLPDAFARDTERMARFQREAKVLASLNHPNIATIYGLEDSGATHALVMELVEGPTLADRIKSGPISIGEALPIAKQICEALEYAHEHGIVHRDLKPANVKVTSNDAVKILDFGLAKAIEGDVSSIDIANSPTISRMATQAGVLLGTAAYMSPEQAKGKSVDRRADIWAFGCVLYEMLTGKMAFPGESVTDILAAVIRAEPDWSELPAATPARVRVLLQRCLQKDPKQRLQAIGDARISLDEVLAGTPEPSSAAATPVSTPPWRRALPWIAAGVLAAAAVLFAFLNFREKPTAPADMVRFTTPLPEKTTAPPIVPFALSPDGRQLAFGANGPDGILRLWIRSLDSLEARSLTGSEMSSVSLFFWSPDSRYIAFRDGGELKKIDASGGPAQVLCDAKGPVIGGAWSRDGMILFGNVNAGLMKVPESGGVASPVTTLDPSRKEILHGFPTFLPDGRHFIYWRESKTPEYSGVYVGSLDTKPAEQSLKQLVATTHEPAYVPFSGSGSEELLFLRDKTLMAQPFDAGRLELTGEPVPLAEQVGSAQGYGYFSASTNGVLAFRSDAGAVSQLTWFDPQGKSLGTAVEPASYDTLSLSPDGTRAVVSRSDNPSNPNLETLWLVDFSRGTSTRFTFGSSSATLGVWSSDGSRVIFASNSGGEYDLYQKLASGVTGEQLLLKSSDDKWPISWSRDGRFLLYQSSSRNVARGDLWVLPLEGDKKPFPFQNSGFNSDDGQFSPDGRWVAYVSDESGRNEIYVRTFSPATAATGSDTGGKWLISTAGGTEPRWRGDGKELYYLAPDNMVMAVEISANPAFSAGVPKALFQAPRYPSFVSENHWDVTRDGKRYLFAAQSTQAPFTVVVNWQAGLKK
jgi:eukaryotic-like serine/threonine-protein kinase